MSATLGYDKLGTGDLPVIVLNDWLCDTSTWDGARAYLDRERFSWVFADLRGYGRSIAMAAECTVAEGARDVLALADALGFSRFVIVGHSMSTLIAMQLGQQAPERITAAVLLTPAPPRGFGADAASLKAMQTGVRSDDETRARILRKNWGTRLSEGWLRYKLTRWRATSEVEAVARYVAMYARDALPDPSARISVPVLAVTGEQDAEVMRSAAVRELLSPICEPRIIAISECGHYPMQETPPLLVSIVERFLGEDRIKLAG